MAEIIKRAGTIVNSWSAWAFAAGHVPSLVERPRGKMMSPVVLAVLQ